VILVIDHFNPCLPNFICCCTPCFPFQIRLAGLQGNLAFELFRLKGCNVIVHLDCPGNAPKTVEGKICNVGIDFVDILQKSGCTSTVVTVLIQRICKITWPDHNCNPCKPPCPPKKPCPLSQLDEENIDDISSK